MLPGRCQIQVVKSGDRPAKHILPAAEGAKQNDSLTRRRRRGIDTRHRDCHNVIQRCGMLMSVGLTESVRGCCDMTPKAAQNNFIIYISGYCTIYL